MKKSSPVEATLLFTSALYHKQEYFTAVKETLYGLFGEIALESPAMAWDNSEYYKEELGWPITRNFLFFKNTIDPLVLPDIKLATNKLEEDFSINGKRNINLDPGYMTLSKVVLASTKNYSHRLYIGKGIFAELTLVHTKGSYRPQMFTYRDYAAAECIKVFEGARNLLKQA